MCTSRWPLVLVLVGLSGPYFKVSLTLSGRMKKFCTLYNIPHALHATPHKIVPNVFPKRKGAKWSFLHELK